MTTFGVLYYNGYNRGVISKNTAIEYNRRVLERGGTIADCYDVGDRYDIEKKRGFFGDYFFDNTDPILVEMYEDNSWYDEDENNDFECLNLVRYDVKFRKYLRFNEYDSAITTPYIQFDSYLIDTSKSILKDTSLSDKDKLVKLAALYDEPCPSLF